MKMAIFVDWKGVRSIKMVVLVDWRGVRFIKMLIFMDGESKTVIRHQNYYRKIHGQFFDYPSPLKMQDVYIYITLA